MYFRISRLEMLLLDDDFDNSSVYRLIIMYVLYLRSQYKSVLFVIGVLESCGVVYNNIR